MEVLLWIKRNQAVLQATEKSFMKGRVNRCGKRHCCLILSNRNSPPAFSNHTLISQQPSTTRQNPPTAKVKVLVAQLCLTLCHPIDLARLLCAWNSPRKNTGVGCHSLLQGIFPTQGSNLGFLHCRQTLYHLSHKGSPTAKKVTMC